MCGKGKTLKSKTVGQNTKLLFLDFDGVLNSYSHGSYRTHTPDEYGPSHEICERIKKLCERSGAQIIISSNWRKFDIDGQYRFNENFYTNPLSKVYGLLGEHIIGTLPPYRHVTKAECLILWFEETGYMGDKWVILDDDKNENLGITSDYDIKNHYIEVDPEFGITEKIIEKIEKYFKE